MERAIDPIEQVPASDPRFSAELDRRIALEQAITTLLDACGVDRGHKDFTSTASRVARVWSQEFLSGFDMDPAKILGDPVEGEGESALVVVRGIPFHGLCPHHLLPYTGTATVAYLPAAKLAGFGRLADLVACFTRRLTLQERACNDVVDALVKNFVTPLIGAFGGIPDFSSLFFTVNNSRFGIGDFINALLSFLVIAAVVYFFIVLPVNKLMERYKPQEAVGPPQRECPHCLSKIPVSASRCAFCTQEVPPVEARAAAAR